MAGSVRSTILALLQATDYFSSEAENANYFVESRASVPLQSSFKPNVTVLSRKPGPTAIAKKDATAGVEQLSIQDDEDDEGGQARPKTPTPEERALKAQREREKKQKKYDEARERLFGVPAASPGSTPPRSGTPVRGSASERGKGRGRGGGAKDSKENKDSRPTSSASGKAKQLFDPSYAPKPDSAYLQRKEAVESGGAPPMEEQIIRTPKGPDGSGRGGFGFVRRGDKAS